MPKKSKRSLLIVESPAKASTIEKYLGAGYSVISSYGHVRDLPTKKMGIDIKNGYDPEYVVSKENQKTVKALKQAAKKVDEVILASDEDREGEAIAWHVAHVLGFNPAKTKRIVFHEITKPAILKAMETPRYINQDLVDAQQARRILDRLVGYELSPLLWRKIRRGLSAGRVQSVAVRLIAERESEIVKFIRKRHYAVSATLSNGDETFVAKLEKTITKLEDLKPLLEKLSNAHLIVDDIVSNPMHRSAPPPFTTSLLQQAASKQLGISVKQTMMLAQRLYEAGHITYMRTDSMNLSDTAKSQISDYIVQNLGEMYLGKGSKRKASKGAQEAHEAIRPTNIIKENAGKDERQKKLYAMIRRRTIASQMANANLEKTEVYIDFGNDKRLVAAGVQIKFPGFMAIEPGYGVKESLLPTLSKGETLNLVQAEGLEKYKKHPARYSEASLVRALEKLGIGRPSTYAPTISTIQDRGYVEKRDVEGESISIIKMTVKPGQTVKEEQVEGKYGNDKNKLVPTSMGMLVNGFLSEHFPGIIDYDFTAGIEEQFDTIASGTLKWPHMVNEFYLPFHMRVKEIDETVTKEDAGGVRELGIDPTSGKMVYARLGRFGPVIQLGESNGGKDEKPKFAPFPRGKTIETVTLEDALPMLLLPRVVGKIGNDAIEASIGPKGPYIRYGKHYVSVSYDEVFKITEKEAVDRINQDKAAKKQSLIKSFPGSNIIVKKGRYGPYVADGKINASIPRSINPDEIELAEAINLIKRKQSKKARKGSRKYN